MFSTAGHPLPHAVSWKCTKLRSQQDTCFSPCEAAGVHTHVKCYSTERVTVYMRCGEKPKVSCTDTFWSVRCWGSSEVVFKAMCGGGCGNSKAILSLYSLSFRILVFYMLFRCQCVMAYLNTWIELLITSSLMLLVTPGFFQWRHIQFRVQVLQYK